MFPHRTPLVFLALASVAIMLRANGTILDAIPTPTSPEKIHPVAYFTESFTPSSRTTISGDVTVIQQRLDQEQLLRGCVFLAFRAVALNDPAIIDFPHPPLPAAHIPKDGTVDIFITRYKLTESEFDCEGNVQCLLPGDVPYFSNFRIRSTHHLAFVDKFASDPTFASSHPVGTSGIHRIIPPMDGWLQFAADPIAYQSPANLPPLRETPAPDPQSIYSQIQNRRSSAELRLILKVNPYLSQFCIFTNTEQIDDAEAVIHDIRELNLVIPKLRPGRDYPETAPPVKTIPVAYADAYWAEVLKLTALARREFGKWRWNGSGLPPGGAGDTGNGWSFENQNAADEFKAIHSAIRAIYASKTP